jgi:peptidoglycan/xylan/chitin deacetylase (PgdA/CDA1 family)
VRRAGGARLDAQAGGLGELDIATPDARRRAMARILDALRYLPPAERQRRVDAFSGQAHGALPADLMMTEEQVRQLVRGGMSVGAHTMSHPILATLGPDEARAEIRGSKRRLEEISGEPVTLFAYPNGRPGTDYRAEHVAMVREEGFEAAVSTAWGVARAASDPFQLPRFTPWDRTPGRFVLRLLHNTFRRTAALA